MTQPRLESTETLKVMQEQIEAKDETPDDRYHLEEYFEHKPGINADMTIDPDADDAAALAAYVIANKNFELLGTSVTSAKATWATTVAGINIATDGAENDQIIIAPHLDTNQTAWSNIKWGTENAVEWEATLRTGGTITTETIWAGLKLTNTPDVATDANQIYFRYCTDDSQTKWSVVSSIANTDVETTTPVTVAIETIYKLQIKIDANRIARCYINDVLVYTSTALTNDINLIPYIGIMNTDADVSASNMIVCYEKISRDLFE